MRLAAAIEISGEAPNLISHLAHVKGELAEIFEEDVRVSIPELPSLPPGRSQLAKAATDAVFYFRTARVTFAVVYLNLDDAKTKALVLTTATLHVTDREGASHLDKRVVHFQFAKKDNAWRIRTLTVLPKTDGEPSP